MRWMSLGQLEARTKLSEAAKKLRKARRSCHRARDDVMEPGKVAVKLSKGRPRFRIICVN